MNDTDQPSRDPAIYRQFLESMNGEPPYPPAAEQIAQARRSLVRRRVRLGALCAVAGVAVAVLVPADLMRSETVSGPALDQDGRLTDSAMVSL